MRSFLIVWFKYFFTLYARGRYRMCSFIFAATFAWTKIFVSKESPTDITDFSSFWTKVCRIWTVALTACFEIAYRFTTKNAKFIANGRFCHVENFVAYLNFWHFLFFPASKPSFTSSVALNDSEPNLVWLYCFVQITIRSTIFQNCCVDRNE